MWSHYASTVCLQFDVGKDPANLMFALPVEYSDEDPVVNWVSNDFNRHFGRHC
jgi:hypothetical protein